MSFLTAVDLPFQRIEALASAAFGPGSPELRAQANLELSGFSESIESLAICRQLLQSSQNMYALSLASSSLVELVTLHWFAIGQKELSNLQSYIFELLLNQLNCNDGNYPIYVKNNLIRVLGRITKLGLCRDGEHHRKFMRHLISVASQRVEYQLLVFTILIEIITEVNEKSK